MKTLRRVLGMTLRTKVFLSFGGLLVVALGSLSVYTYRVTFSTAETRVTQVIEQEVVGSANRLSTILVAVELQAQLFSTNPVTQAALRPGPQKDRVRDYEDYLALRSIAATYETSIHVSRVRVFLNTKRRFFGDGQVVFSDYELLPQIDWYPDGVPEFGWIGTPRVPVEAGTDSVALTFIRQVRDLSNLQVVLGIVAIDIGLEDLNEDLSGLGGVPEATLSIVNHVGRVLASSEPSMVNMQRYGVNGRDAFKVRSVEESFPATLLLSRAIVRDDLFLVAEFALEHVASTSLGLVSGHLVMIVIVAVLAFVLAYLIAGGITRRIQLLALHMNRIETSGFQERMPMEQDDEITELTRSFNRMSRRIRVLIEDVYIAQLKEKESQIKLLQARINPHFLYNTLDALISMAAKRGADDIRHLVEQISSFFRLSLNSGSELTTVARELKLVTAFVAIQRVRFEYPIKLAIDIDPEVYKLRAVVMSIQPIVENSLSHGFASLSGQGTVRIRGHVEDGIVHLAIEDNGTGMSEDARAAIQQRLTYGVTDVDAGYGLVNVDQRLRQIFGEEFGLSIESYEGVGTRVTLNYPADLDDELVR